MLPHTRTEKRLFGTVVLLCLLAQSGLASAQPAINVPAELQFPDTPINLTATLTMTVGNTGPDPLVVSSIATNYADFTADLASFTVPSGGSVDVVVTYAPTSPGQKNKTLSIAHNGPGSSTDVDLKGKGLNASAISAPAAFDFGHVVVGNSGSATIQVSNGGSVALNVSAVALSGADAAEFSVTPASLSVAAGGAEDLTVTFTPLAPGAHAATLTLTHNAAGGSTAISLAGTGTGTPQLSASAFLDLGTTPVTVPVTGTLTVTNPGNATLTVSSHNLTGGGAAAFAVSPASLSIPAGNAADLTVSFTPSAPGAHAATLTLTHNAAGGSTAISLTGTGTGTSSLISAVSSLALGNSPVSQSTQGTLTVSNPGNATLAVSAITLSGGNAPAFAVSPASLSISPGDAAALTITFTPSAAGAYAATLTLTHNAPGNSFDISLTGVGAAARISVVSALNLGKTQALTSVSRTLTVGNPGDATLTISGAALSGGNAAAFAVSPATLSISPGASGNMAVTFTPAIPGVHAATLTLTHNAGGAWTAINLSGTATRKPAAQPKTEASIVAPSSLDFGSIPTGEATSKTLTIRNGGTSALNIQSIAVLGNQASLFSVSATSVTLGSGGVFDLIVSFISQDPGAYGASLALTHPGADSPFTIALTGTGLGPIVSAPDELVLRAVDLSESVKKSIRITNTGNAALTIENVGFSGSDSPAFSVRPGSATVAPGAYGDLLVEFSPGRTGAHAAELSFDHNAQGGHWRIAVTGVGTEALSSLPETEPSAVEDDTQSTAPKPAMDVASSLDLGAVAVGEAVTRTLTVANTGDAVLFLSDIRFEFAVSPISVGPPSLGILPGARADLTITFAPLEALDLEGDIIISCEMEGSACRVSVRGTGTLPRIDVSASSVDVGAVTNGQTTSMSILVRNPGNAPLTVTRTRALARGFEVSPESFVLEAEGVQVVTVQYTPASLGTTTGELVLEHNGPGGKIVIPLVGRAVVQSDLNNDGRTDVDDFIIYITGYHKGAGPEFDMDSNGAVNSDDLIYFLTTFI